MSRQARVGLLVLAGFLLFLVALFAIANRSFLFSPTYFIKSKFASVAGLQPGAAVQYQGVNVGRVESVQLPDEPLGMITVEMAIRSTAWHLVRKNTQAQIKTDGLVGNQIVVLVNPGAEIAAQVEEGEVIRGIEPFDLFEITDTAMVAVARFEEAAVTLNHIMRDIQAGQGTLGKFIYDETLYNNTVQTFSETQRLVRNLGNNAEALVALAQGATEGVNNILTKIDSGEGTAAKMLNDPGVYNVLLSTADTLQSIAGDLRGITSSAENAAGWAELGMARFAENMTALQHNWLLRGYFEERGYYERAPHETRERAIQESFQEIQKQKRDLLELEQRLEEWERQLEAERESIRAVLDSVNALGALPPEPEPTVLNDDAVGAR